MRIIHLYCLVKATNLTRYKILSNRISNKKIQMHSLDRQANAELKYHLARARLERSRAFFALSQALLGFGSRWVARYARWRQRRRDLACGVPPAELPGCAIVWAPYVGFLPLDHRTLRDIGLGPSNIGAAVTDHRGYPGAEYDKELVAANDDRRRPAFKLAN